MPRDFAQNSYSNKKNNKKLFFLSLVIFIIAFLITFFAKKNKSPRVVLDKSSTEILRLVNLKKTIKFEFYNLLSKQKNIALDEDLSEISKNGYYVIISTFKFFEEAKKTIKNLEKLGFSSKVYTTKRKRYSVRVGPVEKLSEAKKIKTALGQQSIGSNIFAIIKN